MNTTQWERTKLILEEALRLRSEERSAYLDVACATDRTLRTEVESLISSYQEAGSQFLALAAPDLLLTSVEALTDAPPAQRIGPYRLIQELGQGGMGRVWLAEQTAPVQRKVALKVIKGGMFDSLALQRFQLERQSLAIMDHPTIAKVFDAGATPDGQPYFVMEYVPGVPITNYCDRNELKIPERLELFIKVCEGVQHAHQKAIIHRDLKPANILVVEVDGQPLPRIIDFGLAKGITPDISEHEQFTMAGALLGTPGYMSPEQANPGVEDVDTRTDVYSLGAILYVLLTGSPPFETESWQKKPLHEALRELREDDPPLPGSKVGSQGASAKAAALARGMDPKQLTRMLRGDLDLITMKALERDRASRYAAPSELAADIRRYLRHEPVHAQPARLSYRARKYIRRHRIGVTVSGILATVLVAFAALQSVQLRRITRERDRADRTAQFMTEIFKVSDPGERLGNIVTAREVLDKAAHDIDAGLKKDPELQARMMHVMGRAYLNLGLYPQAQSLFERALRVSSSVGGQESRETFHTMHDLAWALLQEGNPSAAESLELKLLDSERRVLGPDHGDTVDAMGELGFTLCQESKCDEGVRLNTEVLEKQKRTIGPEALQTLITMDNLAIMLDQDGRPAEAEKLEREALQIHLRVFGAENLSTINSMNNLAGFKRDLGRDEEADKLFHQVLELEQRLLGPDQPETAQTKYDLASILARNGHVDEALSLLRDAVDHGLVPLMDLRIEADPLFTSLQGNPRFAELVAYSKQRANLTEKK